MSLIKCNDIQNASGGIPTVKSQQLIPTAWVNFNGTGTVAIRGSEGVSSLTDVAVGKIAVNFAVTMANTNYTTALVNENYMTSGIKLPTTTEFEIATREIVNNGLTDATYVGAVVMGGQA